MSGNSRKSESNQSLDHLFRHEYGKLISLLASRYGAANIDEIEDAVQESLLKAMHIWSFHATPKNPTAWLYRVAQNRLIDVLRRNQKSSTFDPLDHIWNTAMIENSIEPEDLFRDEQLKLIFACCHSELKPTEQVMLSLKLLCGFSIDELAAAFMRSREAVKKTITRAKQKLRETASDLVDPASDAIAERVAAVLQVLYLMFTKGYKLSTGKTLLNKDICEEAIRLGLLICESRNTPQVNALLALMCFKISRFETRINADGSLVTLEHQDRSHWDTEYIEMGIYFLKEAQYGVKLSSYHLEAAIEAIHVSSGSYAQTNWQAILYLYDQLVRINSSPMVALNRLVALEKVKGPNEALARLEELQNDKRVAKRHLFHAIRAEFATRAEKFDVAISSLSKAIELSENEVEQKFLKNKLDALIQKYAN